MITHHSPRTTRPAAAARRRGVLLLVILILLVLFVMMAVTYVLVATRELSSNKALATKELTTDPPTQQLDGAMRQLLVGSTNQHSPLYPHSLLEHMYGPYGITGAVNAVDPNGNATRSTAADPSTDQVVEFTATNPQPVDSTYYSSTQLNALLTQSLTTDGYLDGCVITMTSGQANGLSSRIVRYDASNPANPVFHVLAFKGSSGNVAPASKDTFIINGRAFSGTGFGFNNSTGLLDAKDSNSHLFALLPNPVFYQAGNDYSSATPFGGIGGANTDYEAPDYQHMYLSWSVIGTSGLPQTILPSFHRPDLINYWNATSGGVTANLSLLRQIMLRPMGAMKVSGTAVSNPDHPNFTGGNPNFDAVNGPWDVDNDGDGIADSVWLDLGYPVQTTSDGRMYKPLFAMLCVDLDGRLNLNASGTTEQIAATHTKQITDAFAGTGGTIPISLPRGEGDGPADVDLTAAGFNTTEIGNLLHGGTVNSQTYPGRYGASNELAASEPIGTAEAGQTNAEDPLGLVEHFQFTNDLSMTPFSSYGSPGDLWGRMAVGLDFRGQPIFEKPSWTNELVNCPYNLNLSMEGSGYDSPFTVHELEHLLRPNDEDSGDLPPRLWQLSGTASLSSKNATVREHVVTTDSWDPPSPGVIAPDYLRKLVTSVYPPIQPATDPSANALQIMYGRKFATHIVELLGARLALEKFIEIRYANPSLTDAQIEPQAQAQAQAVLPTAVRQLLPPELIAGLRMNVNRPLGDGRDGNTTTPANRILAAGNNYGDNNTVDEATSAELNTEGKNTSLNPWSWLDPSLASLMPPPPALDLVNGMDVNGDGKVDATDQLLARQLLARHLYVLARLMIDDNALTYNYWFPNYNFSNDWEPKELAIRRIAQWAVNVVDFMDPDNIMTPFEYDLAPFSNYYIDPTTNLFTVKDSAHPLRTWCVDGIIDDGTGALSPDDTKPWRRMVWGCERPELLLTETMAFHDRRVKDSKFDNGPNGGGSGKLTTDMPNPDLTFDQVRIPQGSAFFELYCTGNPNQKQQSGDLYDNSTGQWMLDLGKIAPPDSSGTAYPVWRLAITGPDSNQTPDANGKMPNDVQTQSSTYTDFYSYDTGDTASTPASLVSKEDKAAGGPVSPPTIERVVWFTSNSPSGTYDVPSNQIYYRHGGTALLGLGQYAVIGPREITRIGWSTNPGTDPASVYAAPGYEPVGAKIQLLPGIGGVQFTDHQTSGSDSTSVTNYPDSNTIQQPLAIIAAADITSDMLSPPLAWSSTMSPAARLDTYNPSTLKAYGIGISISEPLPGASTYYKEPLVTRPAFAFDHEIQVTDCYGPLNEVPDASGNTFLDQPEDSDTAKDRLIKHMPPKANNKLSTGTYLNYKTVLLQRLANPLVPWNKLTNPYLTVDWMPIDLTVFNGQTTPTSPDPDVDPLLNLPVRLASRQRNGKVTNFVTDYNLWFRSPSSPQQQRPGDSDIITAKPPTIDDPPPTAANDTSNTMVFPHQLKYYIDGSNPQGGLASADSTDPTPKGFHSLGFVDSYFGPPLTSSQVAGYTQHVGDPQKPFPWLTWNNRPYANIAELMMVPASHPGRLLHEFSLAATAVSPYGSSTTPQWLAPFSHLLNFFSSSKSSGAATNLSQMFEYLRVPSPFVGTDTVLNPQTFAWTGGTVGESPTGNEPVGTAGLHPPFNLLSNYRDPGKVNINTIAGGLDSTGTIVRSHVWNAIVGGDPTVAGNTATGPTFTDVVSSRQGYPGNPYAFDSSGKYPSIFSNPFRSAAGYDMVPLANPSQIPTQATIFRSNAGGTAPLLDGTLPSADYNNASRNAYFYNQSLDHSANKLTTRSNVFAVWITVGYFEVTPWYGVNTTTGVANTAGPQVFDTAHPDGYQLGQELKADTGEIERHRAFYIIDRSIPVGFERGLDLNSDKTVVLKRFIE